MEKNYRHEYKYLISKESAELLRRRLPHFMHSDPHAGPTGQYTIRSLYFDDPDFTAFYEKVSGIDNRTKYRIRCYNYSSSFFKLEKKEKKGHLTRKTAQSVTPEEVVQLSSGTLSAKGHQGLMQEFCLAQLSKNLCPKVLVDYDRTPFVCNAGNTRITIDENLRTLPYRNDIFDTSRAMIHVLPQDQVILEVKFDDFLPGYLNQCLADIPKAPMAISKFAMCLNLI